MPDLHSERNGCGRVSADDSAQPLALRLDLHEPPAVVVAPRQRPDRAADP